MRARTTLITGIAVAAVSVGAGVAFAAAPDSPNPNKPTTTGKPTAAPVSPSRKSSRLCTTSTGTTRRQPVVSYILRGTAIADGTVADVSIDVVGGNRFGRKYVQGEGVTISSAVPVADVLKVEKGPTTRITHGAAGVTAAPATDLTAVKKGDRVVLQYRGPFEPSGWSCPVSTSGAVPAAPVVATEASPFTIGAPLTLKKVTATAP